MQADTVWDDKGSQAPGFELPATDGTVQSLDNVRGVNGTVVAFICNHCPYVMAVAERMVDDAKELADAGVGFVAISANDVASHPEDSFDNMKLFAERHGFTFPYLYDESQEVARAYGAVCTPEFFGVDRNGVLVYRGRLDEARNQPRLPETARELVDAMRAVAESGQAPEAQFPAVGCSIKWKQD